MSLIKLHEFETCGKVSQTRSVVIKVQHHYTKKFYALKRITRDDYTKHVTDLMELILTKQSSAHPNIIKIHGFYREMKRFNGVERYSTFILMDFWDHDMKNDLTIRLSKNHYFRKSHLISIYQSLISAFSHLQRLGIAHRDIKPENILINKEGDICVIDFSEGIHLNNKTKTEATTLVGSPYYMSPEIKLFFLNGSFSPIDNYNPWKSDVFSLGMTLIDISSLYAGEESNLKEKFRIIKEIYGEKIERFLQELIEKDPSKRMDFLELEECKRFKEVLKEKDVKEERIIEKEEGILGKEKEKKKFEVKKKVYNFLENLIQTPKMKMKEVSIFIFFESLLKIFLRIPKKKSSILFQN